MRFFVSDEAKEDATSEAFGAAIRSLANSWVKSACQLNQSQYVCCVQLIDAVSIGFFLRVERYATEGKLSEIYLDGFCTPVHGDPVEFAKEIVAWSGGSEHDIATWVNPDLN